MSDWAILGLHGHGVDTVLGNVARVRMRVGTQLIDEDFPLPDLLAGVPPIEVVYAQLLGPSVERRMADLAAGAVPQPTSQENSTCVPSGSLVVDVSTTRTFEERIAALEALLAEKK